MAQQYNNPFRGMPIISLETQRDDYDAYCQSGKSRVNVERSPFPRKVDLWFAGLSLAVLKNLEPIDLTKKKKDEKVGIISGNIFDTDGWQAQAIMLMAIAVKGNLAVVLNPSEMMDLANGLAAAGVPHIVKMLNEGAEEPIWNLSEAFKKLLQSDNIFEKPSPQAQLAAVLS